ncbi:MAG TPA: GntR family transcriptional regulator [Bryobacteraceae bacterium]|nr:GntR family transcriptional regulator [Bryobacteraceae bacterium]
MLDKPESDAPVYRRIQLALRKRIDSGELQPGDAVPSEREIARTFDVSLMTARHALAEMEHDGLVDRRRGAGTFVALPRIHFNRLASFTEQMASRGLATRSRILCGMIVDDQQEAAAHLNLPAHSRLVKIERVRQSGDQPFALECCYLPADQFEGLLKVPLDRRSLFATLEREYGINLHYSDEEVDATPASTRTAELLGIHAGVPLLRIRQALFSTAGRATVYVIGFYRSDRHTLTIRRFRK